MVSEIEEVLWVLEDEDGIWFLRFGLGLAGL